jgi:peptidoglycan/xylan/chitin deacetylase (PgdA/CDA1 family)
MAMVGRGVALGAVLLAIAAPATAESSPLRQAPASAVPTTASDYRDAVLGAPTGGPAVTPCSAGLVALTFDDGPARGLTPRLVALLRQYDVPATFFMVGSRVHTAPRAARLVARAGFTIGNHTWSHTRLTRLPDRKVRSEMRRTTRELRAAGIRPSTLARPPYGDVDARVRRDLSSLGLVPVLWNVDSGDWRGGTTRQIVRSILRQLRPHRSNIVLQHDGVRNSPASVAAVPMVIRAARRRGYCFAGLDRWGVPTPPVPVVRAEVVGGSEAGPTPARVLLSLSAPTSRPVSVRVSARSGTAIAGEDFVAPLLRVSFPVGTTRAWVEVPVVDDATYEPVEDFHVVLDSPLGVVVERADHVGTIASDDPAPVSP